MPSKDKESRQVEASVTMETGLSASPEPKAATKDGKQAEARVIAHQNDLALVEWMEGEDVHRAWLPTKDVTQGKDGKTYASNPAKGIPYGEDFLHGVTLPTLTVDAVLGELHRRGVWTASEALNSAGIVLGALQAIYGLSVASVLGAAATYERGKKK